MSHHHVFAAAVRLRDLPPSQSVPITLVARRNPAHDHARLLAEVEHAPTGRRPVWTEAGFDRTFGAHPREMDRIVAAADALGFTVTSADARTRLVTLRGPARVAESAFDVDLALYDIEGYARRGHSAPARVRHRGMAPLVEAVLGLDTLPIVRGPWIARSPARGVTYSAQDLLEFYGFPSATGQGETIGLLQMSGGFSTNDVKAYFARQGVRRSLPSVKGPNRPAALAAVKHLVGWMGGSATHAASDDEAPTRWTFETTMDVELAGVFAPQANLRVWFADRDDERGAIRALRGLLHSSPRPTVISLSWALSTLAAQQQSGLKSTYRLFEDALQEAMALGITVCCASGDAGSSGEQSEGPRTLQVEYPAASRYVLACGGTTLRAAAGHPVAETVWNARTAGIRFASGGGLVAAEAGTPAPVPWQAAALAQWAKATPDHGHAPLTSIGRGVPDVACSADFNAGCALIVGGVDTRAGGTSASAPVWAALVARLNSGLRASTGTRLGYATPTFYVPEVARTFSNIATGNNSLGGSPARYRAVKNSWDPCTGLGTPRGVALLAALEDVHRAPPSPRAPRRKRKKPLA